MVYLFKGCKAWKNPISFLVCHVKISDVMCNQTTNQTKPHLTDECDWLLAHGMGITDVCLDDLGERLLHSLQSPENDVIIHARLNLRLSKNVENKFKENVKEKSLGPNSAKYDIMMRDHRMMQHEHNFVFSSFILWE